MSDESEVSASTAKKPRFTEVSVDGWQDKWAERKIGFHREDVHPWLVKYAEKLANGRENLDIFLPLCGKSIDIKWLADQGHRVVGVECSSMALDEFFDEQSVEYSKEAVEAINGSVYKSKDGKILLYCCDFYEFNKDIAGQFDAIWDRASLVAINRCDREKYADLLMSLMKSECRLLLDTLVFDETIYAGPPHYVSDEQIQELFSDMASIEYLDTMDSFEERHKAWGLSSFDERLHFLINK